MKFGTINVEIDGTKIIKETDEELVIPAVLAREAVLSYPNGRAYRPAKEIQESLFTFDGAFLVPDKHPDTMILTKPKQIIGKTQAVTWDDQDKKVKGEVLILKKRADPKFVADVKSGVRRDVSIGFIHDEDWSPGTFNGEKYDYVQRNIIVDHVAVGVPRGRDPFPNIGLGLDEAVAKMNADPWEETADNIRSGHGSVQDAETCRTTDFNGRLPKGIQAVYCKSKTSGDWYVQSYLFPKKEGWTMEKAKTWFNAHNDANVLAVDAAKPQDPQPPAKAPDPAGGQPPKDPGKAPPGAGTPPPKEPQDTPPEPPRALNPAAVIAESKYLLELRKYRPL